MLITLCSWVPYTVYSSWRLSSRPRVQNRHGWAQYIVVRPGVCKYLLFKSNGTPCLCISRVGHNEVIGVCRVGCSAEGLGRDHWNEMLAYPRKPIAHWHPLQEAKKSEKEVGVHSVTYAACINMLKVLIGIILYIEMYHSDGSIAAVKVTCLIASHGSFISFIMNVSLSRLQTHWPMW